MPSYTGFVQPRLRPVYSASGEITDVEISYPQDLRTQMLEYSGGETVKLRTSNDERRTKT
jgi:hypothetical protein